MTRDERLMLAEQDAADPELAGCDVHRPASVSAAEAMREAAAQECEQQARDFLDPAYAGTNPLNSFAERFACGRCAVAIRAMPPPPDPRDAEIAALRAALIGMLSAVNDLISDSDGVYGLHLNGDVAPWNSLTAGGQFEEWLVPAMDDARAALAQSGDAK